MRGRTGSVAFSSDGKKIACGGYWIFVWDAASGAEAPDPAGPRDEVTSLAFAPDGKTLAVGSHDGTTTLVETGKWTDVRKLRGHERGVTSVAFTPGGGELVSGSLDRTLRVFGLADEKPGRVIAGEKEYDEVV